MEEIAARHRPLWLGSPVAFAARRDRLQSILSDCDAMWAQNKWMANDVLFLNISRAIDFVAYKPILCIEENQGARVCTVGSDFNETHARKHRGFHVHVHGQ